MPTNWMPSVPPKTAQSKLTAEDLEKGQSTLGNIRLWDSQPLLASNRQLQQLRVYYQFANASVDRYPLSAQRAENQQVIMSARELDQAALPSGSRTWQTDICVHPWVRIHPESCQHPGTRWPSCLLHPRSWSIHAD